MSAVDWTTGNMPMDGTPIAMQAESIFRFQPYKPNSQEAKRGVKGRWQEMNEYGGWENCSHPLGNTWKLANVLPATVKT